MFVVRNHARGLWSIQKEIVQRLQELADPEVAVTTQKFFPEPVDCFGVRAAELRALSREIYSKIELDWKIDQVLELAEALFVRPELEARSCGLLVLSRFNSELDRRRLNKIRSWLKKGYLDNWALIDTLSLEVLGPFFRKNPAELNILETWALDSHPAVRRAALVSLVKLSGDSKNLNLIFKMVRAAVLPDGANGLVAKAAGWLLREAGKTDRHSLEKFLLTYGKTLPRVTVRYALEKFAPGRRDYIMKKTKS
ncbi:MAG: DNA alkylation repair protein [Candidatus Saccharicenans sp.]|nr:DNA alkylation repair protein [Candidatus Saccharicenans sp.]